MGRSRFSTDGDQSQISFLGLRVPFLVVRLKFNVKRRKRTFESGSDVVLTVQSIEDHHEEKYERQQAQG
jgi:hypothetical protein